MKPTIYRRIRRRTAPARSEGTFFKKESQETFFGGAEHESFFQSAAATMAPHQAVQRKCEKCDEEDQVQRQPDKKEEEKLQRAAEPEKKEEEKVMKKEEKKEEEKLQRAPEPEKKEEEKVMKKEAKKEEEKLQRAPEPEKKEEEKKVMKMEEKKEEDKVQKKEAGSGSSQSKVNDYVGSLDSRGQPLPANANNFFSERMGFDFSDVRIHTDKEAAESAKAVNAKAYAVGNNIVFNEGQYDTESGEGKKLMAHELAHVVQNNSGEILQRMACEGTPTAPPRVAQDPKNKNAIDSRAQAILDIAAGKEAPSAKAISVVTQIICNYYPGDAGLVDKVVYKSAQKGLWTNSKGSKEKSTGEIEVGDDFVASTSAINFPRRVLQVGHELEHIKQFRSGLGGDKNNDEREFLAFADNGLGDEFEGTGRMQFGTRVNVIDAAMGYYFCFADKLKEKHKAKFAALKARRAELIKTGKVNNPNAEPTACARSSN